MKGTSQVGNRLTNVDFNRTDHKIYILLYNVSPLSPYITNFNFPQYEVRGLPSH